MQKIYKKFLGADGVILGSLVYFWTISAQAKTFMDVTYALRYPCPKLRNKVRGAIAITGRRGSVIAFSVINNFFLNHDMLETSLGISSYRTAKAEVRQDKCAMQAVRSLGKQVVSWISVIKQQ